MKKGSQVKMISAAEFRAMNAPKVKSKGSGAKKDAGHAEKVEFIAKKFGLPLPKQELKFMTGRRWRFDFYWMDQMVALEVEGGVWTQGGHTRGGGFLSDMEKYNAGTLMGWRIFRCTPGDLLFPKSDKLGAMLKIALSHSAPLVLSSQSLEVRKQKP